MIEENDKAKVKVDDSISQINQLFQEKFCPYFFCPYFCPRCQHPNELNIYKAGLIYFNCECDDVQLKKSIQESEKMSPEDLEVYTSGILSFRKYMKLIRHQNNIIPCSNHGIYILSI